MEDLIIEEAQKTPALHFNAQNGRLHIKGNSIPEYARKFYGPAMEWLAEYGKNPRPETKLTIELNYFNTSSSASLLAMFEILAHWHENGYTKVSVEWHYDKSDLDIKEAGEFFQDLAGIPFELIFEQE